MEGPKTDQHTAVVEQLRADYAAAILHAAWGELGSPESAPVLLFAWIELLPHEVPPPPSEQPTRDELSEKTWAEAGHFQLPVDEALSWYEECRTKRIVKLPVVEQEVHLPALGDEPPWPRFVLETKNVPFVPTWCHSARTHHLIPVENDAVQRLWPDAEARAAAVSVKA